MLSYLSQKNLLSSSLLVLSFFLLSPEGKAMEDEKISFKRPLKAKAVQELEDKLIESEGFGGMLYKDLPSKNKKYIGRSNIYNCQYPKAPMVHFYHPDPVFAPFSAFFSEAYPSFDAEQTQQHKKIYSFVVQSIGKIQVGAHYSFKPQYLIHHDSPTRSNKAFNHKVEWTAVAGAVGQVEPLKGSGGLLPDVVSTHPAGAPLVKVAEIKDLKEKERVIKIMEEKKIKANLQGLVNMYDIEGTPELDRLHPEDMILSGNSLHLRGIDPQKSVDFSSLVTFEEDGEKIAAVTYHWLLNDNDLDLFNDALREATTFRQLITALALFEPFNNILNELKKYVGLLQREEIEIIPLIQKKLKIRSLTFKKMAAQEYKENNGIISITTDNNAKATYQATTDRMKVTPGERVKIPYDIKVEDGGKMSFGVLNTKGDNWIGGEAIFLEAGSYTGVKEILIPEGETDISVVLRNYHLGTPGQSKFTAKLGLEKEVIQKPISDKIFKAIPLTFKKLYAQEYKEINGTLTITTDNNNRATYQAITNRMKVTQGETFQIPYEIKVEKGGKMSFGVLNTKGDGWIGGEVILETGTHKSVKEILIPQDETDISLVLRNYHLGTAGQSKFTAKLGLEKEVIQKPISDKIFKAIPLTFKKGTAQDYKENNGTLTITTDNNNRATYQAITNRVKVTQGETFQIPYEIKVESGGKMSFGVLNTKGDNWIGGEVILETGTHKSVKEILIPQGETDISLVLRNYHLGTAGQSKFTAKLGLEKEVIQKPISDKIFKAIPLKFKKLYAQEYTEKDGTLTITTDNNNRATYQATTNRIKVTPGEVYEIPYKITVEGGGKIAFGVLNSACNGWIEGEVVLTPGTYDKTHKIMIPKGESEISLVLLNYHLGTPGQSKFTAKLGLEKVESSSTLPKSVEIYKPQKFPVRYEENVSFNDINDLNLPEKECEIYDTIGNGNCFFHAILTKHGQNGENVDEQANEIRSMLPTIVMSSDKYKNIIRKELLADYRVKISKNKIISNNLGLDQLINTEYQDQIIIPEEVLLEGILDKEVEIYLKRYATNSGRLSSYIKIPVGREMSASIANVIAEYLNIRINCFLKNKENYLVYAGSIGPENALETVSILLDGLHYSALDHKDETEERKAGIRQTARNAGVNLPMISDLKIEKKEEKSLSGLKGLPLFESLIPEKMRQGLVHELKTQKKSKVTELDIEGLMKFCGKGFLKRLYQLKEKEGGFPWLIEQLEKGLKPELEISKSLHNQPKQPSMEKPKEKAFDFNNSNINIFDDEVKTDYYDLVNSFVIEGLRFDYQDNRSNDREMIGKRINSYLGAIGLKGVWEKLGQKGQEWLIEGVSGLKASSSPKIEEKSPQINFESFALDFFEKKKEPKELVGKSMAVNWPKDVKNREFTMNDIVKDIDKVFPKELKIHFAQNLQNKKHIMFDVSGGGDCLGYVLQLSREDMINILRKNKNNQEIRKMFANEVAIYKNPEDYSWVGTGAPTPDVEWFEKYINHRYVNQRENLDAPVARAMGIIGGFSVYIWSADDNKKEMTLTDAYYNPAFKAEKHILLAHGHYSNLLTLDASQEEINTATLIEKNINQANNFLNMPNYDKAFEILKVSKETPFVHKLNK
jgi:hypothetical protein